MTSQTLSEISDNTDYLETIVSDLVHVLDRLDAHGLTEAGAKLASVLDWLHTYVSDGSGNAPAI